MSKLADHLKVEATIDPKTGEQRFVYYYKRKRCPRALVKGPLCKQYIGYYLISKDLDDAESWLEIAYDLMPEQPDNISNDNEAFHRKYLGEEKNHMLIKSLFFSSLIFYGKCFAQAKGRGTKLERSIVPEMFQAKHDEIKEYRNSIAAHSGEGRWDTGVVSLLHPPKKGKNIGIHIMPELNRLDFIDDRKEVTPFVELIQNVREAVKNKSDLIGQRIISDIIVPKGRDYWLKKSK